MDCKWILFVNTLSNDLAQRLREYAVARGLPWRLAVIRNSRAKSGKNSAADLVISCDFAKTAKIAAALKPYQHNTIAMVCRGEKNLIDFAKLSSFAPYVRTPNRESILWGSDKLAMRRRLSAYNPKLSPKFLEVTDDKAATIRLVKEKVGFPVVVKPTNLSWSMMVSYCADEQALKRILHKTFKKIEQIYKENGRQEKPGVLVEKFMKGERCSVDVYVDSRGRLKYCPFIAVVVGRQIGFEDFFGYKQICPAPFSAKQLAAGRLAAKEAIYALGLRNTTVHVELMRYGDVFKVIELSPRIGGFIAELYELSHGFDHALNDVLNRIPLPFSVNQKAKAKSALLMIYGQKEGRLKRVKGLEELEQLKSVRWFKLNAKPGELCRFSSNGGKSVVDVILANRSLAALEEDIAQVEKILQVEIL